MPLTDPCGDPARRVVLDACVLYPTVLREVLLAAASAGFFVPVWSDRLMAEWQIAAARLGPGMARQAANEAEALVARFPEAAVATDPATEAVVWLPDPADRHVLATAIAARAGRIATLNLRDFPRRALSGTGVGAVSPDDLLMEFFGADHGRLERALAPVIAEARRLSDTPLPVRALMRKAHLPRLGKALEPRAGA